MLVGLIRLSGIITALLFTLMCAAGFLISESTFVQWAERIGHADDLSPERLWRLRLLSGGILLFQAALCLWAIRNGSLKSSEKPPASWSPALSWRRLQLHFRRTSTVHHIMLLFVLFSGVALRWRYIDIPMEYDEAYSFLNYARRSLYQALSDYNSTNNHLLNTLFMHIEYRLVGQSNWGLRLHVLLAGICVMIMTYRLGCRLMGANVGLLSMAFVSVNFSMIDYSVNARGYMLVAMCTLALMNCAMDYQAKRHRGKAIQAALIATIGLYAMPIMVYPIVGCGIWYVLSDGDARRSRIQAVLFWGSFVTIMTLWLYFPALVFRGIDAWTHPFVRPISSASQMIARTPFSWWLALRSFLENPLPWWVVVLPVCGSWLLRLPNPQGARILRAMFWGTFWVMIIQRVTPPPRIFTFLIPVFSLCWASGLVLLTGFLARSASNLQGRVEAMSCSIALLLTLAAGRHAWIHELPGGVQPIALIMNVSEWMPANTTAPSLGIGDQMWRLSVQEAAEEMNRVELKVDRVLVGLPADLPFIYELTKLGLEIPVNAEPSARESIWLLIRPGVLPADAIRDDPALGYRDEWLQPRRWEVHREIGHLTLWKPSASRDRELRDERGIE